MIQHVSFPTSGPLTPELTVDPSVCAKLEAIKADTRRYTLTVNGYENMILPLRQSNAQDDQDPAFVEMTKQLSIYENLLKKSVNEFGCLLYCNTPGCPVHETPTSSPLKTQSTKRKEKDGFTSPPLRKISKTVTNQKQFKINLENIFTSLKPQGTQVVGGDVTI
ncbi:hypothetical protein TNIN_11711 [Trichonephila inaurata madagascariensis]|uniref:Uncharacterized protein n=1 Tax=Trichonephila inaurata madagascariensis TaxID=2747483 RepID=A0A8X6X1F4_9ARAC|nr:hypothetical protein TNIN_11711 [Trichonephila inaurata madagascariensis]